MGPREDTNPGCVLSLGFKVQVPKSWALQIGFEDDYGIIGISISGLGVQVSYTWVLGVCVIVVGVYLGKGKNIQ